MNKAEQAVISGTYSDLKFVKSRGIAQIVIEVPIEQAQNVVMAFGTPMQASDVWVVVARLETEQKPQKELTEGERAKRHFEAMCQDEEFCDWFWNSHFIRSPDGGALLRPFLRPDGPHDTRSAAKVAMGIQSANDLLDRPNAWRCMYNEFQYRNVRK